MGDFDTVFGITPPGVVSADSMSILWLFVCRAGYFTYLAYPPNLI